MRAIELLHESDALLVVRKDPGVLSQQNERGEAGLVELLSARAGGPVFPVHRLDRETGGVMVFAKTAPGAAFLSGAIQRGDFHKAYLAILTKPPAEEAGTLENLLFYDRRRGKSFPVRRKRAGVKEARLRYQTLARRNGLALVQVFPETGRTHQIRVQFAAAGCPLCGDGRYGGGSGPLALFCRALAFPDPETTAPLCFSASPVGTVWDPFEAEILSLPLDPFSL